MTDRLLVLAWYRLPLLAGRLARTAGAVLSDGAYLVAFPALAAFLPPAAFALGLLTGWLRFGAENVFTESVVILVLAIVLAFLGAALGGLFAAGYALADFFLYQRPALGFDRGLVAALQLRAALPLTYAGLCVVAIGAPLLVQLVRAQLPLGRVRGPDARVVLDTVLGAVLAGGLVFVALQSLPLLVRPLFTWQGRSPTVEAMFLVQGRALLFALLTAAVAGARVLAEYAAAVVDPEGLDEVADHLDLPEQHGWWERRSSLTRCVTGALAGTYLLAGLITSWLEALLALAVLLGIEAVRWFVLPRVPAWARAMAAVPAVVRLVTAVALSAALSSWLLPDRFFGESFLPLLLATLLSLALVAATFPESARAGAR
jgi:hypothetical protein